MPRSGCAVLHGVNPIFLKKIIGLEILSDRTIFSAHHQVQGSFDSKHRQAGEVKTKEYIFIFKIFTNSYFQSYTAISIRRPRKSEAIAK